MTRLVLAFALAAPVTAAAADAPKAEVFAGYSHARHQELETDGFEAELDVGLGQSFGLGLSVAGHYKSELGTSLSWTSILAGPRWAWRGDRLTPFVHGRAGVVRLSAGIDVLDVSIRETETGWAAALGGGVDVRFAGSWAVRLQGDWVLSQLEDETDGDPRASIGIVYRAGRR
jgi:opacity protein-like surface antigen